MKFFLILTLGVTPINDFLCVLPEDDYPYTYMKTISLPPPMGIKVYTLAKESLRSFHFLKTQLLEKSFELQKQ